MKALNRVFLTAFVLIVFSCKDKEVEPDVFSEDVQMMVPQRIIDDVRSYGMVIHSGTTPPNIEGIYLLDNRVVARYWDPTNTNYNGQRVRTDRLKFYNQSADNQAVEYEMKKVGENQSYRFGDGLVSGNGNKFTYFEEEVYGNSSGVYLRILNIISGEITDAGISNYHEVSQYIKEKTSEAPSHVSQEEGECLIYKSQDGKVASEVNSF